MIHLSFHTAQNTKGETNEINGTCCRDYETEVDLMFNRNCEYFSIIISNVSLVGQYLITDSTHIRPNGPINAAISWYILP
jgi:hypothetical protein